MTRLALAWWLSGALPFAVMSYRDDRRIGHDTKRDLDSLALASALVGVLGPTWWIAGGLAWGVCWGLGALANLGEDEGCQMGDRR